MPCGLAAGCVSWGEACATRGREDIIGIFAPLLHSKPWRFLYLRETKEELSTRGYLLVPRVLHTVSGSLDVPLMTRKTKDLFWEKNIGSFSQARLKDPLCKHTGTWEVFMLRVLMEEKWEYTGHKHIWLKRNNNTHKLQKHLMKGFQRQTPNLLHYANRWN